MIDATLRGSGGDVAAEMAVAALAPREAGASGLSGRAAWPRVAALARAPDSACDVEARNEEAA